MSKDALIRLERFWNAKKGGENVIDKNIQLVTQSVVQKVIELLQDKIYKIILYGSYARGDFTSESDIDIMILLNCSEEEVRKYRDAVSIIASRVSLDHDIEVSLLLNDKDSFYDRMDILKFYQNVQNEGDVLYE